MQLTESQRTREAAEYVDSLIGFYIHLFFYVVVIAALVVLNWRAGGEWWAQWAALGWGLGVIGHALIAFGRMPRAFVRWRLRKIDKARSAIG